MNKHQLVLMRHPVRYCALCDKPIRANDIVCKTHYRDMKKYQGQPWFEELVRYERDAYRNDQRIYRAQFHKKRNYAGKLPSVSSVFLANLTTLQTPKQTILKTNKWLIDYWYYPKM